VVHSARISQCLKNRSKLATKEIDFVAEKQGKGIYVQLAYRLADKKMQEREFGNLLQIKDNIPKFAVWTMLICPRLISMRND